MKKKEANNFINGNFNLKIMLCVGDFSLNIFKCFISVYISVFL